MNYNHDEILDEMKTNGDNASDSENAEKILIMKQQRILKQS